MNVLHNLFSDACVGTEAHPTHRSEPVGGMLAYRLDKEVALVLASAVDGKSNGAASGVPGSAKEEPYHHQHTIMVPSSCPREQVPHHVSHFSP